MKTNFVNVFDITNDETRDLFTGIQCTIERVMNGGDEYMKNYEDALNDLEDARGYCFDILDDIKDGKEKDADGIISDLVNAYIGVIDAQMTIIRLCNQGA